mmetsp:Transcript_3749/g.11038  ORF Transcript_3749/g.11038 Transcript_3749/m.11038 type:complete len:159 (-) Transcript_3749:98-574(-)
MMLRLECDDLLAPKASWGENLNAVYSSYSRAPKARAVVLFEGYMQKRGFWNPAWKERYFVLDNCGRLYYYKSKSDRDSGECSAGRLALNRFCSISVPQGQSGQTICFDIQVPANGQLRNRTFHLCAPSLDVFEQWSFAVEKVKKRVIYVSFPDHGRWW